MKTPKELDVIVDTVLAYKPKPKTKAAKRHARLKKKAKKFRDGPGGTADEPGIGVGWGT